MQESNLHNAGRLQNTRPNVATEREERSSMGNTH